MELKCEKRRREERKENVNKKRSGEERKCDKGDKKIEEEGMESWAIE